jgi:hypothetical protein
MPSGPFRVLDEGSIGRPFRPGGTNFIWCDGPLAPVLSVAAGLAAYSRESQDPKRGEGADIVIRAIDSGAIRHTIQTDARIMALAASPRLVAWWQAANALVDGEDAPWALIRSALGSGSTERASVAGPIDPDRRVIFIDDVTVVTTGPTSERSPTVFWEEGQIRQLPAPGAADAPSACRPTGVFDGTVSMACVATDWITGSGGVDLPVLWSEELGHWIVADLIEQRTALGTHRAYDTAMLSDGWLVWGGEGSDGSEWSSEIAGVPLGGINGVP